MKDIVEKYSAQNSIEVKNNHNTAQKVIEADLLDFSNNLVRHDSKKIKKVIEELLK